MSGPPAGPHSYIGVTLGGDLSERSGQSNSISGGGGGGGIAPTFGGMMMMSSGGVT